MRKNIIGIAVFLLMTLEVLAQGTSRVVDYASSSIKFKIKNAGIGVDGHFSEFTASVQFDPKNLATANIEGKIKTTSINTGINGRDNHLRKEEFFYVDKYAEIHFKSTSIKQQGNAYSVAGKLTIKDVTKDVLLILKQSKNGTQDVYETSLTIDRLDFHIGEDSWTMSDEVLITIKITTK